jgi:hypothetical protein
MMHLLNVRMLLKRHTNWSYGIPEWLAERRVCEGFFENDVTHGDEVV